MLKRAVRRARTAISPSSHRDEIANLIHTGYRLLLGRAPDTDGEVGFARALRTGWLTPAGFLRELAESTEYRRVGNVGPVGPLHALHEARCAMVRSLPQAETIVDLGGAADGHLAGALVVMGYPYPFRQLTIVEPPIDDRHDIYRDLLPDAPTEYQSDNGPVRYLYRSMADLAPIPSASIDLVFSGESFEHVTRADGERVLAEARRILKPTGSFCFDTPNRAVTKLQCGDAEYINPDHKYEYTHAEMVEVIERHGFEITEAKGITWIPSAREGRFDLADMIRHRGMYDDIENCYLLYYRCRPI